MPATPVDIVRRFLENAADPAVITELVADDAIYVSLNDDDEELHRIMPWAGTKHGRQAFLDNLRDVFTFWTNEEWNVAEVFGQDERVAAFGTFTHRSNTLQQTATTPFPVFAKVVNSKIVYFQFQEDTFATARTFRSGGTWTIHSDPQGEPFEI